ncbi:CobW family GTP-binding protein [Cuneatibacter caecimuris]|uniref:G3E family GTPase n=1 Tax=Cuneatibacter caecimuris TaxID=1796618 RepID=A0A4Q7P077_9FIRM|nr:GTP-binding protein [Cuneatibacter caecimuris]RZS92730.1 G3E family GTPase [Cuneatibacter caecimuris]
MTKVDIVSGFLGAGKTTLIKQLISGIWKGEKIVLIENEFGEIGIDGGFLKNAGVEITEMNSGCICCTLVGDFSEALKKVVDQFAPDRIIIEPSGVGKLSDVARAVEDVSGETGMELDARITVADAKKARMYMKNFGEFFNDQIEHAGTIVLSRTQDVSGERLEESVRLIRGHNAEAAVITTPWDQLTDETLAEAVSRSHSLLDQLLAGHDHEDHSCCCHEEHDHGHDHDHEEHDHLHDHDHEDHSRCGHSHEDHDHCCGHEDHDHCGHENHDHCPDHHHHHHADEVFTSWGRETAHQYTKEELESVLKILSETALLGNVLRAKGIVPARDGGWMEFDLVPGEYEIRKGAPDYTGKLCVIGTDLPEAELAEAFKA